MLSRLHFDRSRSLAVYSSRALSSRSPPFSIPVLQPSSRLSSPTSTTSGSTPATPPATSPAILSPASPNKPAIKSNESQSHPLPFESFNLAEMFKLSPGSTGTMKNVPFFRSTVQKPPKQQKDLQQEFAELKKIFAEVRSMARPNGSRIPNSNGGAKRLQNQNLGQAQEAQPSQPSKRSHLRKKDPKQIQLKRYVTVKNFSQALKISISQLITQLDSVRSNSKWASDSMLTEKLQELIAVENGFTPLPSTFARMIQSLQSNLSGVSDDTNSVMRPPVVCIMGHVDHGKTTLLDRLRQTDVAAHEAGGITQHIGAFTVSTGGTDSGKEATNTINTITFLDTPGHAAFHHVRRSGARKSLTDVVVIVVAADAGLQPQTIEAISLAATNEIPIIVAINKCDLENADPSKVIQQLAEYGVVVEDKGGDVLSVNISGKTGQGIDDLKEAIALSAELLNLRAAPALPAHGAVLEARATQEGTVISGVVRDGTLKVGDHVVSGFAIGKVRSLLSAKSQELNEAGPSVAVNIIGFRADCLTSLGDSFEVVPTEERAREVVRLRKEQDQASSTADQQVLSQQEKTMEELQATMEWNGKKIRVKDLTPEEKKLAEERELRTMRMVVKADVKGSLDVLTEYVTKLKDIPPTEQGDQIHVELVRASVGDINEADIEFAKAMNACIFGFGVEVVGGKKAIDHARQSKIHVFTDPVVYKVMDNIRSRLSALLPPQSGRKLVGEAKVLALIELKGLKRGQKMTALGCEVKSGALIKEAHLFEVRRGGEIIFTGPCVSLRHFKDNVERVDEGKECALVLEDFKDVHQGDSVKCLKAEFVTAVFDDSLARRGGLDGTVKNPAQLAALFAQSQEKTREELATRARQAREREDLELAPKPRGEKEHNRIKAAAQALNSDT